MEEITIDNFDKLYPDIEKLINKAKFIAIDTEFSALCISDEFKPSLFDSPNERYRKLCGTVSKIIPLQVGLTTFCFDPDNCSYLANTLTFYICPRSFMNIDKSFVFQASSLQFLCNYNFDFNKFVYKGIPYLNSLQEIELKENLKKNDTFFKISDGDFENFITGLFVEVNEWVYKSENDEILILKTVDTQKLSKEHLYSIHKSIRAKYSKIIYTYIYNDQFTIKKVSNDQFNELMKNDNLEIDILNYFIGFTRVVKLLINAKKPLIGHNLLTDLLLLYNTFEKPLPKSYLKFKHNINQLFPIIFDTKSVSFDFSKKIDNSKHWDIASLRGLYEYFKDGHGRHLVLNSPFIELQNKGAVDLFHNAGFDAYCTGYIFIRMAHFYAVIRYDNNKSRNIMSTELLHAVSSLENKINVIRCSVSYIKLDGNDPESHRPQLLIAQSLRNKPVDLKQVANLLSTYGYVEVKPSPASKRIAIIAVDNFGSSRRILKSFRVNSDFRIRQYNVLLHSSFARAMIWSSVVATGVLFAFIAQTTLRK